MPEVTEVDGEDGVNLLQWSHPEVVGDGDKRAGDGLLQR
jgi:hypothetical protein